MPNLVPRESPAQPAGGGDDSRLPAGVVDGLVLVLLTIELEKESEFWPCEVDMRDEVAVRVLDEELSCGGDESLDATGKLHHQRLEQAARWRRAIGP